jgi:protein SCO1/2
VSSDRTRSVRRLPRQAGPARGHRAVLRGAVTGVHRAALLGVFLVLVPGAPPGLLGVEPAAAQRAEPLPDQLAGVGVSENLEQPLPLDTPFVDETGRAVILGDYFQAHKPVILNLAYYGCPMLCGLIMNGLVEGLKDMSWTPGQEFEIVTLSFDPKETAKLASLKKTNYIRELGRPSAAGGWHFLTGREADIRKITDAVGFQFRWNEKQQQFAHAAVLIVCTPEGRVSRYLYGVEFPSKTLRLSLVEAADGKIGSSADKFLLFCFHYDAEAGRYAPAARNLMKAGGALMVLSLGALLTFLWRREKKPQPAGKRVDPSPGDS